MPRKRSENTSSVWVTIRLTVQEKASIEAACSAVGMSVSDFVRDQACLEARCVLRGDYGPVQSDTSAYVLCVACGERPCGCRLD